jgi:uncharacterized protein Yka (UPF0111/DUF47 family)
MNPNNGANPPPRPLENVFKDHLQNSIECGQLLGQLFVNLDDPVPHITKIKRLEEKGDRLTAEAHDALEPLLYSGVVQLIEQFVNRLDDITDGMNTTARTIDVFRPAKMEDSAQQLLSTILSMISRLLIEVERYPRNELSGVRDCRGALKVWEENADLVYHEWRKEHRRRGRLPLRTETDWTEILGTLEQTTDACYHGALLLERISKHHHVHGPESDRPVGST